MRARPMTDFIGTFSIPKYSKMVRSIAMAQTVGASALADDDGSIDGANRDAG
jgi:hypothetical protein